MNSIYENAILKALNISSDSDELTPQVLENIKQYAKKHHIDLNNMTANLRKAIQNPLNINKEGKMSESKDNPDYVPIKGTAKNNEIGVPYSPEPSYVQGITARVPPPSTRVVDIGSQKYTKVMAVDRPEFGVNHLYHITDREDEEGRAEILTEVRFQKGPIKEHGVNGCHHANLIAIVIDRLQGFQETKFECTENDFAINLLNDALYWLNKRTNDRAERGVEGTSEL